MIRIFYTLLSIITRKKSVRDTPKKEKAEGNEPQASPVFADALGYHPIYILFVEVVALVGWCLFFTRI